MSRPLTIDLFVEDRAHEAFIGALVRRVVQEEEIKARVRVRSARGGHGHALYELRTYLRMVEKGVLENPPELVVAAIDGNCSTPVKKKAEIEDAAQGRVGEWLVAACPDPHIERWFLADPDSFHEIVGHRPRVGRKKCERNHYKRLLSDSIRRGGHPSTLGGIEFAVELVDGMDLFRAGKADSSLRGFVDDLRAKLRGLTRRGQGSPVRDVP